MNSKWSLFSGILLLTTGIILRIFTDAGAVALILIVFGVLLKSYYIIDKARSGEYKPGFELVSLFVGLSLFFLGLYYRLHEPTYHYVLLMVSGLILKTVYIIMFIIKVKQSNK